MPKVVIELREGRDAEQKRAISDAVHEAMVEAFGSRPDDRLHLFLELPPEDLVRDDVLFGRARGAGLVSLTCYVNRRAPELKERFFEATARNLEERAGVPRADVVIMAIETEPENWWVASD